MNVLSPTNKSLDSICSGIGKNKYNFDLDIQRHAGVWKKGEKSLLIDTVLRGWPIYPALLNKHTGSKTLDVVDFKQRFLAFYDYKNNKFALDKNLKPVIIDGVEYEIAGKKFDELDEELQIRFNDKNITLIILEDATEEELCEIFSRINMGRPLNNSQKRSAISDPAFRSAVYELSQHPVIEKLLTKAQIIKGFDRDVIILALMLICSTNGDDYTSFRSEDINDFVRNHGKDALNQIDTLKTAMDNLNTLYEDEKKIGFKQTTVPMIIYCCYRCVVENKSFDALKEIFTEFINNYDNNEEYKLYLQSGVNNQPNVQARFNYWKDAVDNLQ